MLLNGTELVERFNRPSTTSRLGLRMSFLHNGAYVAPFDVSSCTIFPRVANLSPYSVLGDDGLIRNDADSEVLMNFEFTQFDQYTPAANASGIYVSGNEYIAVLDGQVNLSGVYKGVEIENQCSATQEYIDVWTVKLFEGSDYQTFVNTFELQQTTLTGLTQPLLLSVNHRLINKHVQLGSNVNLKITSDIVVENREIDQATKNIIQDSPLVQPIITIKKHNEDSSLPSEEVIVDREEARLTADNTIIYNFNAGGAALSNLGGVTGTYSATVDYLLLDEFRVSKPFYFIVR